MNPDALDRHITGNWGEDQLQEQPEEEVEALCERCGLHIDHHREQSHEDIYGNEFVYWAVPTGRLPRGSAAEPLGGVQLRRLHAAGRLL